MQWATLFKASQQESSCDASVFAFLSVFVYHLKLDIVVFQFSIFAFVRLKRLALL